MQTAYVLKLQGTGDDEYAYEVAGVFTTEALAQQKLVDINAEYTESDGLEEELFTLGDTAQIEAWPVNS